MGASASQTSLHQPASLPAAINSFGTSLFNNVVSKAGASTDDDPPGGLFISPYGIAQALAMLLNGVEPGGELYRQLQAAVFGAGAGGNSLSLEDLNAQLQGLSAALVKEPSGELTVSDANSAWVAQRYSLQERYAATLAKAFGATAQPITTAAAINRWVSKATRGKITEILDEGAAQQAVLVLVNALYFKGLWRHQFSKRATFPMPFYPLSHSQEPRNAAAMFKTFEGRTKVQVATFPAAAAAAGGQGTVHCTAVRLPYVGGEYAAVAAMPVGEWSPAPAVDGQRALLTATGDVPYSQALAGCRHALLEHLPGSCSSDGRTSLWREPPEDVKVFLPRFEVEFGTSLVEALQALGITQPFKGGDITGIASDEQGRLVGDLAVTEVAHKVFVKVDEEGTEAAAATAVIALRSMPLRRPEIEVRFDRPFVFAVVHEPTRVALFAGEVYRPEEWQG